jgi:hypothetical protein
MLKMLSTRARRSQLSALASAVVALVFVAKPAAAQDVNLRYMISAKGECRWELVRGAGYNPCQNGVIYMLFKNGRHLLLFSNRDNIVIGIAGAGDRQPRLEDYYMNIDTMRLNIPGHKESVDTNMEGECHILVSKDMANFRRIECDVYDRAKGLSFSARVDNIVDSTVKHFN